MSSTAASRRRLAAAVTVTLAVTLAAGTVGAPAFAAPAAGASAGVNAAAVLPFPKQNEILLAGTTGFLASYGTWTGYDGKTAERSLGGTARPTGAPNIVAVDQTGAAALQDVSTGKDLFKVDTMQYFSPYAYAGAAGGAIFTLDEDGLVQMHTKAARGPNAREVRGLPKGLWHLDFRAGDTTHGVVDYSVRAADFTETYYRALVDLASATVGVPYEIPQGADGNVAVTPHLVAWSEGDEVVLTSRITGVRQRFTANAKGSPIRVGLLGDWITYVPLHWTESNGVYIPGPLTARNLITGATRTFLAYASSAADAPDGSQLVRGGTKEQGEGLYRIALGADGAPVSTLVASTGQPTGERSRIELLGHTVPAVSDLDRPGPYKVTWTFGWCIPQGTIEIRHVESGRVQSLTGTFQESSPAEIDLQDPSTGVAFPNGDYTWTLDVKEASPKAGTNNLPLKESGTFRITRKTKPHDFDDNGSADLLARDASGTLWSRQGLGGPLKVGTGWGVYDRIEAAGNLGGSAVGDVVARDRTGVLWLHKGIGDGRLANRIRVGTGWNTYGLLAGGSDVTGDGRPDLLGVNAAGVLWVHQGTGRDTAPFAATRRSAGTGWGVYNEIAAVGNVAGAAAGDLVARDRAGVLWLHLGKGDGTFAPRVRIGSGWNEYTQLVAVGDADRDGRNDLVAYSPVGGQVYLYSGTGRWQAPFKGRVSTAYRAEGATYDHWS